MTRAGSDGLCAQNCLMEQHPAADSQQKRGASFAMVVSVFKVIVRSPRSINPI